MELASNLFLSKAQLAQLFQATLEVTIRIVALSVFGSGFPLYVHYHLHAPWQLLKGHSKAGGALARILARQCTSFGSG